MTLRMFGLSAVAAAALTSPAPAAQTSPVPARSIGAVLDTLDRVRAFHETAISPDGRRVTWVEDVSGADKTTAIYLRTVGTGAAAASRGLGPCMESGQHPDGTRTSPDNRAVCFARAPTVARP